MSEVLEQGATRWARPGDYGSGGGASPEKRSPDGRKRVRRLRPSRSPGGPARPAPTLPANRPRPKLPEVPKLPKLGTAPRYHPLPKPGLGGMAGRILPGIGLGLALADMADRLLFKSPLPAIPSGWVQWGCERSGPINAITWFQGNCNAPVNCLDGQATTSYLIGDGFTMGGDARTFSLGEAYRIQPSGEWRSSHRRHYTRVNCDFPALDERTISFPTLDMASSLDPNIARASPSTRDEPAPEPEPVAEAQPTSASPKGQAVEFTTGRPPRRIDVSDRRPPRKRERHAKAQTGSAKVGVALTKALDGVSEKAEVVDAVYESLPEETRKKWGCANIKRGLIDNAGQYGIDAADCKARAIFHNAHKIDVKIAVENILKNYVQDKVVGSIQRVLPRNIGNAVEAGELAGNMALNDLLDLVIQL